MNLHKYIEIERTSVTATSQFHATQDTDDLPDTMSSKFDLLALPAEVRSIIYKHYMQHVHLILDHAKITGTLTRSGQKTFKPIHPEEMITFIRPADSHKIALLQASTFCNRDAIDAPAAHTTIEVPSNNADDKGHDILALVDPGFLKHVTAVHISPDSLLRLDRTLLPNLKRVRLTAWPCAPLQSLCFTLRSLTCRRCGDPTAAMYYELFWKILPDGRRKRSKLRRLARDEGWDMDILLTFDRFRDRTDPYSVELLYQLPRGNLVYKAFKVGGRVTLPSEWYSSKHMLKDLGYSLAR